jgi:hypothetical protein
LLSTSEILGILGALSTVITAAFGFFYFRQKVIQEAQKYLDHLKTETIETQRRVITNLRTDLRIATTEMEIDEREHKQCQKALRVAEAAVNAYQNAIGSVWKDVYGNDWEEATLSGSRTSSTVDKG